MDTTNLTSQQRFIRGNIRNCFLAATVAEIKAAKDHYKDKFSKDCLDEMLAECEKHGVDSYGKVPC